MAVIDRGDGTYSADWDTDGLLVGGDYAVQVTLRDSFGNTDSDGIGNDCDNCPLDRNVGQADVDGDGVGDACDQCPGGDDTLDDDADGIANDCDNCPQVANPGQNLSDSVV